MGVPSVLLDEYASFVARELLELSWRNNYPILESIGLDCFFQAFKKHGFSVEQKDDFFVIGGVRVLAGVPVSLEAKVGLGSIVRGWPNRVVSCPKAYYDGMCDVYDAFLFRGVPQEKRRTREFRDGVVNDELQKLRDNESREFRDSFESYLLEYFTGYHEHVFVARDGKNSDFAHRKPEIFGRVVEKFPWELLASAERFQVGKGYWCTPTAETLVLEYGGFDPSIFTDSSTDVFKSADEIRADHVEYSLGGNGYHPSVNVLDELFLGMYLVELAKIKGYEPDRPCGSPRKFLAYLAEYHGRGLKNGRDLFPVNTTRRHDCTSLD